jgi:hypothetical protein
MDGPVVLDTSVVIKWFRQGEVLASQALALRDAYLDGRIWSRYRRCWPTNWPTCCATRET